MGKLRKLIVLHRKSNQQYIRYFKTKKGYNAARKAGGSMVSAGGGIEGRIFSPGGRTIKAMTRTEMKIDLRKSEGMLKKAVKKKESAKRLATLNERVKDLQKALKKTAPKK